MKDKDLEEIPFVLNLICEIGEYAVSP